jgi:hypothetical protein
MANPLCAHFESCTTYGAWLMTAALIDCRRV